LDSQTQQKAREWRGKIAAGGSTDEARVTIKGHLGRQAISLQEMDDRLQSGLGVKIRLDLGIQQDRGSRIHKVEDFYDMLLLACGIGGDAGNVFEIHLDFFERERPFEWLTFPLFLLADAVISAQDLPNRARGTG
jgi:hypothetical protein